MGLTGRRAQDAWYVDSCLCASMLHMAATWEGRERVTVEHDGMDRMGDDSARAMPHLAQPVLAPLRLDGLHRALHEDGDVGEHEGALPAGQLVGDVEQLARAQAVRHPGVLDGLLQRHAPRHAGRQQALREGGRGAPVCR